MGAVHTLVGACYYAESLRIASLWSESPSEARVRSPARRRSWKLEAAANRMWAESSLERCRDVPERLEQAKVSRWRLRTRHRGVESRARRLVAVQLEG